MKYKVLTELTLKSKDGTKSKIFKVGEIINVDDKGLVIITQTRMINGIKNKEEVNYIVSGVESDGIIELIKDKVETLQMVKCKKCNGKGILEDNKDGEDVKCSECKGVGVVKNKGGAPTKYKEEFIDKVDEYLLTRQDEDLDYIRSDGNNTTGYEKRVKVKLPSKDDFATYLDINVDTLNEWCKKYEKFSVAVEKITREQKKRLVDMGLSGDYNNSIARLVLSSNHGMKDKSEVNNNVKVFNMQSLLNDLNKDEDKPKQPKE